MTEIIPPMNETMLTVAQWATARGASERSVMRWLADGEIPGAEKVDGRWNLPANAHRIRREDKLSPTDKARQEGAQQAIVQTFSNPGVLGALAPSTVPMEEKLLEALGGRTAYLSVEEASTFLGISEYAIRRNAARFHLEPVGPNGAMMVPQRVIRRIAGV